MTKKQQRKDVLKKYEGKLSGPYDHLKEGVDYLDDVQRNKNNKDRRKELEERVVESLNEIRDKGYTKERGKEYQRRQTEWWKECDKALYR